MLKIISASLYLIIGGYIEVQILATYKSENVRYSIIELLLGGLLDVIFWPLVIIFQKD